MSRFKSWVVVFLFAAATSFAQLTGRLTGTVTDPQGAVVPNASVSLLLPGGKAALVTTRTDSAGIFDFSAVRPEVYNLVVEAEGFAKHTEAEVKVDPAREQELPPIKLALGNTMTEITVTAAS